MAGRDYVDWRDAAKIDPKAEQYVYILFFDTDFEDFHDVFCGVYATEEAANAAADRICNDWYKDNPVHRHHFKIRKEEVRK